MDAFNIPRILRLDEEDHEEDDLDDTAEESFQDDACSR